MRSRAKLFLASLASCPAAFLLSRELHLSRMLSVLCYVFLLLLPQFVLILLQTLLVVKHYKEYQQIRKEQFHPREKPPRRKRRCLPVPYVPTLRGRLNALGSHSTRAGPAAA